MFTRKDRKIANQKVMIANRDKLIGKMEEQSNTLYEENKKLKYEVEDLKEFKDEVISITNTIDTPDAKYNKIKALVSDDQSNN